MTALKNLRSLFLNNLQLDMRSLAAFRIALGFSVIVDLLLRSHDLVAHYTDIGVLPSDIALAIEPPQRYSFHFYFGTTGGVLFLFCVHALIALLFAAGWQTRLMNILLWVFTISLHNRNYMINQGGDIFLRLLIFWSIFLPVGKKFSADAKLAESPTAKSEFSLASVALILQIFIVYFFSSLLKMPDPSWKNGTGLYYALASDQLNTVLGAKLAHVTWFTRAGSYFTVWFELLGPMFIFFPFKSGIVRSLTCAAFMAFHLSTALFLQIGIFPLIGCVAWLALLPSEFWDYWGKRTWSAKIHQRVQTALARLPNLDLHNENWYQYFAGASITMIIFCTYISVVWNLNTVNERVKLPSPVWDRWGLALGLDQKWNMFAKPIIADGWFVLPGKLRDGTMVSLLQFKDDWLSGERWSKEEFASWEKPRFVVESVPRDRWRKFMMNMYAGNWGSNIKMHFARYICRTWNRETPVEEKKLEAFQFYFVREDRLATGEVAAPKLVAMWKHECFPSALERWSNDFQSFVDSGEFAPSDLTNSSRF